MSNNEPYKFEITWFLFYYLKVTLNANLSIAVKGTCKSIELGMKKGQWHVYRENAIF